MPAVPPPLSAGQSFLSAKRSRKIAIATAGALTLATAVSLAATLPAGSSPAPASADAAYTTTIGQQAPGSRRRMASDKPSCSRECIPFRPSANSSNSRPRRRQPPRPPRGSGLAYFGFTVIVVWAKIVSET